MFKGLQFQSRTHNFLCKLTNITWNSMWVINKVLFQSAKPSNWNAMKTICQQDTQRPALSSECFHGIFENTVHSECTSDKQNTVYRMLEVELLLKLVTWSRTFKVCTNSTIEESSQPEFLLEHTFMKYTQYIIKVKRVNSFFMLWQP